MIEIAKRPPVVSLIAGLALALAAAAISVFPEPVSASTYGLWTDQSGGLWCGGSCGSGQMCCNIEPQ